MMKILKPIIILIVLITVSASCKKSASSETGSDKGELIIDAKVTVNYGVQKVIGTPAVFGTCYYSSEMAVQEGLVKQGFTSVREDVGLHVALPIELCPSLEYWKENQNSIQDVSNWQWKPQLQHLEKAYTEMTHVILIMDYMPPFLSYSGTSRGLPKDWNIWQDIIKKTYLKWKNVSTHIEIWNEPNDEGFFTIEGSPYEHMANGRAIAFADLFYYTAAAIREVDSQAVIGGPALAWGGPDYPHNSSIFHALFQDSRIKQENLINFLSYHEYINADGEGLFTYSLNAYRTYLNTYGWGELPIYLNEFNVNGDWRNEIFFQGRAHSWFGKNLIQFINEGIGANIYATGQLNTPDNFGLFYRSGNDVEFAHFTNSWRLPSVLLKLGEGSYNVVETTSENITAAAAINASGEKVWLIANDDPTEKTVAITLSSISIDSNDKILSWISAGNHLMTSPVEQPYTVSNGDIVCLVTIPSYAMMGFKADIR